MNIAYVLSINNNLVSNGNNELKLSLPINKGKNMKLNSYSLKATTIYAISTLMSIILIKVVFGL
jgi:hypothetical protein